MFKKITVISAFALFVFSAVMVNTGWVWGLYGLLGIIPWMALFVAFVDKENKKLRILEELTAGGAFGWLVFCGFMANSDWVWVVYGIVILVPCIALIAAWVDKKAL